MGPIFESLDQSFSCKCTIISIVFPTQVVHCSCCFHIMAPELPCVGMSPRNKKSPLDGFGFGIGFRRFFPELEVGESKSPPEKRSQLEVGYGCFQK